MRRKTRNRLIIAGLISTALVAGPVGTCSYEASRFNGSVSRLPCGRLSLPEAAGRKPLTENICVAVSGEQPKKIGIERTDIGGGRTAHTLFLEWDFDGITEGMRKEKPDAEPITLITKDGIPVEIHVRSHWRVGVHDFNECRQPSGKVVVAVSNAFHTPVVVGCEAKVVDPKKKGGMGSFVFGVVSDYARAVGQWFIKSFRPLRDASVNEVPAPDHPARTQPLFFR